MFTPETSKHFKKYVDESGVVSYILTTRFAPVQQGVYYTNPSMTDDGRYFIFWGTYPPGSLKTIAVLDFETDEITIHTETVGAGIPLLDTDNGDLFYSVDGNLYRSRIGQPESYEKIASSSIISRGVIDRFQKNLQGDEPCSGFNVTHILRTKDKKTMLVDSQYRVNGTKIGSYDFETGEYQMWTDIHGRIYNHGAICPTNSDLALLAEEFWTDAITGKYNLIRTLEDGTLCRILLVTRDGKVEMIPPMFKTRATHEWWAADGKSFYSVDMTMGLCRYTLEDKKWELRVPGKAWHGHCTKNEKYYVSDIDLVEQNFRGCESRVRFFNYETKKDVFIITENPRWNAPDKQNRYHMDPHPQFTCNDKYVAHTVTVDGHIDVAITPVDQLIEMTK
jgi:hypothetical protein